MIVKAALALSIQLCAVLASAGVALADPVQFASAAINPTPFMKLQAELHGTVAMPKPGDMIAGDIYKPPGTGPFPAIVALHGCEGWPATADGRRQQADKYVAQGYVFLAVDSFGPRGIEQACVSTRGNPPADRLGDAYGALDWLDAQPFVDASRVALLGASQGGSVVLLAISPSLSLLTTERHFAAGVAFYPVCSPSSAVVSVPLLVLIGALDDWSSAVDCQAMLALPHDGGAPEQLLVFPGAYHAFNGQSMRTQPREVFGHHLEYDENATKAANAAVAEFLSEALRH
jgi:dienelactone hydrolase